MESKTLIAVFIAQIIFACNVISAPYTYYGAQAGYPGSQPPGFMKGMEGAPDPFSWLSGGPRRPVSPGGRIQTSGDDFGSIKNDNNNKDSPQQEIDSFGETGVKDSPQMRPDSLSVSSFESGVREDTFAPLTGCRNNRLTAQSPQLGNIGSNNGGGGGLCLELMCGSPCANGYEVDPKTGCKTCKCLRRSDSLLQSCPSTPIKAMWKHPSTDELVVLAGQQFYTMSRDGSVLPNDQSVEDVTNAGTLCEGIDAAFTSELSFGAGRGKYTVYFSGGVYSIYSNMFGFVTGPHSIHKDYENGRANPLGLRLPPWAKKVDSAFVRGHKLYLFFKYDENIGYFSVYDVKKKQMRREYPKRTSEWWVGLPLSGPDGAAYWNSKIYFTVGDKIYVSEGDDIRKMEITNDPVDVMNNFMKCSG